MAQSHLLGFASFPTSPSLLTVLLQMIPAKGSHLTLTLVAPHSTGPASPRGFLASANHTQLRVPGPHMAPILVGLSCVTVPEPHPTHVTLNGQDLHVDRLDVATEHAARGECLAAAPALR